MAQTKRRRVEDNSADENTSESEAESNSRPSRNSLGKRRRLSPSITPAHDQHAASNGNGHATDSSEDEVEAAYTYTYTAPRNDPSANIEIFSDDDADVADVDEDKATEYVRQARNRQQVNMPSDSGIIEEVSMRNFMCHARLTIPLGPLINFIVGNNGSGKSAILTALTICLGAKASVTNRAGSLKNFIKEGEDSAWVSVRLKNEGDNAYQPDVFGHSIIVERHFTRSGTSGFRVKNSEGRLVSTKKSILDDIVDFFALQIDNPINVLSQDMARQFLNSSTPYDKYKFFIKGTQLEQLDKDYNLIEQLLDSTEGLCEAREADVAVLGERKRRAEEKQKMAMQAETLQTRINEAMWQHAWAQIEEQERRVDEFDAIIRQRDQEIERAQAVADEATAVFDHEHQDHDANVGVIADLEAALLPKQEEHREAKARFDENKRQLTESLASQRVIKEDYKRHQNEKRQVQAKIDAEHARIENANGPAHAEKVNRLEESRVEIPALHDQLEQHRATKPQLENAVTQADQELRTSRAPITQKQEELGQAEKLLQQLERAKGDQSRAFPDAVHQVRRAIQNAAGVFHQQPVGPIAMYISLKKPEWSTAIERTIGGSGNAFVVTSKQDQTKLSKIMRQHNCISNIIVVSSNHINVESQEPAQGVDTILRVVDIENDMVRNALIINNRIEQTVLIADQNTGNMYSQEKNKNVFAVIVHHPKVRGEDIRYSVTKSGSHISSPVRKWDSLVRLKTSAEEQISRQKSIILQARQELDQLRRQERQYQQALNTAQDAVRRHNAEAKKLREKSQRAEDRVQQLEDEINQDDVNDTSILDELHAQLQQAETDMKTAQDSYQDSVNQKDAIDDRNKQIKQEVDAVWRQVQEMEDRIGKFRNRADQRERSRHQALTRKNHALGLLEEAHREKNEVVEQRDTLAQQIRDDLMPQAEEVHSRIPVPPGMTTTGLDALLDKLQKQRQSFDNLMGGNRQQILEKYQEAKANFKRANHELTQIKNNAILLKRSLLHRKGRWIKFRKYITSRAQINFFMLLSERGFRGRIIVNHRQKMLDISIEPDSTEKSERGRQTGTLSGGEKSFSTICMLLSIWEAMGSPIRCLDEFDVFMDQVNREISMKMIIQAAGRSVGRQFVLITPQNMDAVRDFKDVKIFPMKPPERGQTTLPFGE